MIAKLIAGLVWGLTLASVSAAATYDEATQGDLSNDRLAPTPLLLDGPSNLLAGSVTFGERDYFTVVVPVGAALNKIILTRYESSNARAFIGFQAGSQVTVDPSGFTSDGLLGYMHFGFDQVVPSDLLDDLSLSIPPSFSIPLPAGNYSFWVNQTEPAFTSYEFHFITTASVAGDYNNDLTVDAADYTVWRDRLNSSGPLANETVSIGTVDEGDYAAWKSNFGATGSGGAVSALALDQVAVPEPGVWVMFAAVMAGGWAVRRRH